LHSWLYFLLVRKRCRKKTAEKISGYWNFTSIVGDDYYGEVSHPYTNIAIGGDYADFRADGKVYSRMAGMKDTAGYTVISAAVIKVNGVDYDIKALTDNQFVIYNKTVTSSTVYDEATLNLSR
jgi:hypothetical protein